MNQPAEQTETAKEASLDDERRLIERARIYPLAFGELFDRYYDEVYRYLLHRTANVELAQDMTSDTFHIALKKLWMFRWQNVPFSAWLFRIATNEVNGYYRKHKNYKTAHIEDFVDRLTDESSAADFDLLQSERELQQKADFVNLHKSISHMRPKYQTVITLRFFEEKTFGQIAQILGKPEGTVKSLTHRALEQLRKQMEVKNEIGENMGTDKLIDKLQNAEVPGRVPLSFKNTLRRQLLNSNHFCRAFTWRNLIRYIATGTITAAVTAMIILYMITPPSFSSAKELLDHIESAYDRAAQAGQMYYLRTLFKSMSSRIPLEEEEWSYDHHRQFSVKTRNALTGEILGFTIKKDGKMYSLPSERMKFKFNIEEKAAPPNNKGAKTAKEIKDLRVLVVPLAENTKTFQVYIFNDARTPEMFAKQTPLEIIRSLRSDSLVSYAGRETNPDGDFYEILEVYHSKDLYLFRVGVDQKLNETIPKLLDQIEMGETPLSEKVDVHETIKIDTKANKICRIIHSVRQNNLEIERMELTFMEEKYLDYDPAVFDAARQDLKEILHNE